MIFVVSFVYVVGTCIFAIADDGSFWEFDLIKREWRPCKEAVMNKIYAGNIDVELAMSARTKKVFNNYGVQTVGDLFGMSEEGTGKIRDLNNAIKHELKNALERLDLVLSSKKPLMLSDN